MSILLTAALLVGSLVPSVTLAEESTTQAEFFSYDFNTGQVKKYSVILPGITIISALMTAPDGKIWGMAENKLFIFDPSTETVTYQANLNLTAR